MIQKKRQVAPHLQIKSRLLQVAAEFLTESKQVSLATPLAPCSSISHKDVLFFKQVMT